MVTELREDWGSWHRRFKAALDEHKSHTGRTDEDVAAEAETHRSSITQRDKLKAMISAAPAGKVLEIRLSPVHNRQEGTGYQALDTEYIPQ